MINITKNENAFDRFIKILVGSIIIFLIFYFKVNIILLAVLLFAALWMVITGLIGYCPLYHLLGINTQK
ncbi:MAG: DUF2892 domain-containing protein [Candidatus Margulisiibacteriota bacterium]|jgi:hypothetical protein